MHMSLKKNLARIRTERRISQTKLAEAAKVSQQLISRLESGTDLTTKKLPEIARALGVSVYELDENYAPENEPERPRAAKVAHVPLLDYVTAGRLKTPSSQIPVEDVPLLAFADLGRGEFFALRLEDDADSMDRVSPPGSVIIVNKADRELRNGKYYIFSIDGETTYKMWVEDEPAYLAPYSTNPMHKPIFVRRKRDFDVIGRVKRTVLDL